MMMRITQDIPYSRSKRAKDAFVPSIKCFLLNPPLFTGLSPFAAPQLIFVDTTKSLRFQPNFLIAFPMLISLSPPAYPSAQSKKLTVLMRQRCLRGVGRKGVGVV